MQTGLVVGTATTTVKHRSLDRAKLLVVQLLAADGKSSDGDPVLAIDQLGAGPGETVIVTNDGKAVREHLDDPTTPVRWSVMGIQDQATK